MERADTHKEATKKRTFTSTTRLSSTCLHTDTETTTHVWYHARFAKRRIRSTWRYPPSLCLVFQDEPKTIWKPLDVQTCSYEESKVLPSSGVEAVARRCWFYMHKMTLTLWILISIRIRMFEDFNSWMQSTHVRNWKPAFWRVYTVLKRWGETRQQQQTTLHVLRWRIDRKCVYSTIVSVTFVHSFNS